METSSTQLATTASVLSALLPKITDLNASAKLTSQIPISFFERLGIQPTFEQQPVAFSKEKGVLENDISLCRWRDFRQDTALMGDLQKLFIDCQIVAFSDWANVHNGSDLWYGLLSDAIKPLRRKDFDFIFYLGDASKKLFFEVDEILDIISEFSLYGRVTFALDEVEAAKLWALLNGENPETVQFDFNSQGARKKYFSLFNTVNIAHLIIYSQRQAMLFSQGAQFEMLRRSENHDRPTDVERGNFIDGFGLGLSQKLEVFQCLALGIIAAGASAENGSIISPQQLCTYASKWLSELQSKE